MIRSVLNIQAHWSRDANGRWQLNWSWGKKHLVLLSIIWASLLTDFSVTYGSPLFLAQSVTFHMSVSATSQSVTGCLLLQAIGGVLAVPFIQRYGRLPVLFWSQFLTALFLALASISPGYGSFTVFRTLQGLVNTAPQVLGLSMVHDMFFFHVRCQSCTQPRFCASTDAKYRSVPAKSISGLSSLLAALTSEPSSHPG